MGWKISIYSKRALIGHINPEKQLQEKDNSHNVYFFYE